MLASFGVRSRAPAFLVFAFACFGALGAAPAEASSERKAESGAGAGPPSAAPAKNSALSFSYAGAVHASGNILSDAVLGLDALEALINTQFINAPEWTPIVRAVGPVYQIPDFVLRNDRFLLQYERRLAGDWFWTVGIGVQVLYAFANIPVSFVELDRYGVGPGYIPVTRRSGGRLNLAQSYQADGSLLREFGALGMFTPFVQVSLGVGSGWLGKDRSAWLQEAHLGLSAGATVNLSSLDFLRLQLEAIGYQTTTRGTNFVDRTQVLVNPGKGEIVIVQVRASAGRRF